MASMLKWTVSERPVGRYRSFETRAWPICEHKITNRTLFLIDCLDEYTNGKPPHGPLTLRVAKATEDGRWKWVQLVKKFDTLPELKAAAQIVFDRHPEWFV